MPRSTGPGNCGTRSERRAATVLRVLFSILSAVGIVFVFLEFMQVHPRAILDTLETTSPLFILYGLFLHLAAYGLRSVRFRLLVNSQGLSVRALFPIVAVHNFLNHVLPMRAGELSYVYLVHDRHGVSLGQGFGSLAIARTMDFMSFLLFFPLAVIVLFVQGHRFPPVVWSVLTASVPLFFLLAGFLLFVSVRGRTLLDRVSGWGRTTRFPLLAWGFGKLGMLETTVQSFEHLRSKRVYLGGVLLSFSILGCVYLVGYVLLAGMGYPMSVPLVVLCSTLAYLGFLFPIYSFAGLGMLEAGWTAGCVLAGFPKEMGVASGFAFHVIVLIYVTLLGLVGMAWGRTRSRANTMTPDLCGKEPSVSENDALQEGDQEALK